MKKASSQEPPAKRPPAPPGDVRNAAVDVSESFRSARSALGQITADLERLRRHAASLVKGTHRPAR